MAANAERNWKIAIRADGGEGDKPNPLATSLEIAVYDAIGKDFWTGEGITARDFLENIRLAPNAKAISLRVNTNGGIVDDAKAMLNLLGERAAAGVDITGFVDGIAASCGSYLLTVCKRVVMPSNAFQMLHQVRGGARGTADDMATAAELFRRTNEQLAEAYAAASARRGKGKTKEEFLAAFSKGDTYLNADEAIAWGLADEKIEAIKVAACLADITGIEGAPDALRSAPYVAITNSLEPPQTPLPPAASPAEPPHKSPPGPSATDNRTQNTGKETTDMKTMSIIAISTILGLSEDSTEEQVVTETKKLKANAAVIADIESIVGAKGQQAVGVVRAMKESNEQNQELGDKVAELQAVNARRDFESERDKGLADRKLTPATAKLYNERFDAALADSKLDPDSRADKARAICEDLKGFLKVAPRIVNVTMGHAPTPGDGDGNVPVTHNGKAFEAMAPIERKHMKDSNPELYNTLREDAITRGAL